MKICTSSLENVSSLAVYRSSYGNIGNLTEKLVKLIDGRKSILIIGDFNICTLKKPKNIVTSVLQSKDIVSLVYEATHIQGGCIDQAYWKDEDNIFLPPTVQRYSPYYSDHDAICIVLTRKDLKVRKSIN